MELGYALSSEEHPPLKLVDQAVRAEAAGMTFALISDHYHPWTDRQGNAPFVWGVLGAIAARTSRLKVGTGVTCPTIRMHPAIVAHAAATAAALLPGRFFLGVGTGESLNEHVLGDRWPAGHERRDMLEEAVEIMRKLWTGTLVSHRGDHYTVESARLYTLPAEPISVAVAAGGRESAKLAGKIGDALIATSPDSDLIEAYLGVGGNETRAPIWSADRLRGRDRRRRGSHGARALAERRASRTTWPGAASPEPLRTGRRDGVARRHR